MSSGPNGQLLVVPVEGEARIRDIDLGERLGFERPADIRKLIERHRENLNKISILATVAQIHQGAGRPSKAYYLNRKQAIFITAKSETAEATDITIEIIDRFDAYERGMAPAKESDEITISRALLLAAGKLEEAKQQIAVLEPKAAALDRIALADGDLTITEAAKALGVRPKDLFTSLKAGGWIYKRPGAKNWLGYQNRVQSGLLTHKVNTVSRSDGSEKIVEQVLVTPKGLTKLAQIGSAH
jgi:phage antirepressor YoqD-like protein